MISTEQQTVSKENVKSVIVTKLNKILMLCIRVKVISCLNCFDLRFFKTIIFQVKFNKETKLNTPIKKEIFCTLAFLV